MKRQQLAIIIAAITLVYLCIMWPLSAGAQTEDPTPVGCVTPTEQPEGCGDATPEISATWWVPPPVPTPRPMPIEVCWNVGCAYLPVVLK